MNADALRELLRRVPFQPFAIHLSNGDIHEVRHPEQVFIAGSRLLIHYPATDVLVWASLSHVASITIPSTPSADPSRAG